MQVSIHLPTSRRRSVDIMLSQVSKERKGNLLSDKVILTTTVTGCKTDLLTFHRDKNYVIMEGIISNKTPHFVLCF